jgi:hypothetical protein
MDAAEVLPLVFSAGGYPGKFIIAQITERRELTSDGGLGLAISVDIDLKEYVEPDPLASLTAKQMNQARGLRKEPIDGKR